VSKVSDNVDFDFATSAETQVSDAFQGPVPVQPAEWIVAEPKRASSVREPGANLRPRRRSWLVRRALATADAAGLTAAFAIGQLFIIGTPAAADRVGLLPEALLFVATLPAWVLLARAYGLYDRDEEQAHCSSVDDVWGVLNMVTLGTWMLVASSWLTGVAYPDFRKLFAFWASAIVLVSCGRILARTLVRRTETYVQNTLIIGAGDVGQLIAKKLLHHPEYGLNIVGFIDDNPTERRSDIGDLVVVGGMKHIALYVELLDVERVIVAFSGDSHETTLETIRELETLDVQIDLVPRLFEGVPPESHFHSAEGLTLIALPRARLSRTSLLLKRSLDIVGSLAGLILVSPLLLAAGIAIRLDSRGPILFRQTRMGRNGNTFEIIKFRTMTADADARKHEVAHLNKHLHPDGDPRMFKVHDDPRITRAGRFLRRTSVDELPQLWNVLVGKMSLVGPRPLILDEHAFVDGWGLKRLELKPGITGLWQVLGRDDIPFNEMVELDYRYVTGWSLWNDVKLMCRTIPVLLRRQHVG
jgi:exopolysaccharide biosynthesis polyprenyl glycosylphosphotransferase